MSTQELNWDEINADETISKTEQATSNDISFSLPVGKFVCSVVKNTPIEKTFNAYSCHAASLEFGIESIIEIEQPIFDENQKKIVRNGEIVMKKQPIHENMIDHFNALFVGQTLKDDVNLYHPSEKDAMKKRRLFVAKKLQIIDENATELPTSAWPTALGKKVIIETEWNSWKDKNTGEIKKNVKVAWAGYEKFDASKQYDDDIPFDADPVETTNTDNDSFDDI